MHCQITSQSLLLIKGFMFYLLLISFMEKQLNTEAESITMEDKILKSEFTFKVERLQNTSSCAYVVEPIKDHRAVGQFKELYDIKCVNVGHSCSATNERPHVCMQTYKMIKVHRESNKSIRIYTGCVCAYDRHSNKSSIKNLNF